MKKILGLDLGTNSIGWALVNEAESENEKNEIIKLGVRVVPLTNDEQKNFNEGKTITTNAERTSKRSARRGLQRFKLRRTHLINAFKKNNIISETSVLCEDGKDTTFETLELRAKAAIEKISLNEFAKVLLHINKKRGYKSSRKSKNEEENEGNDNLNFQYAEEIKKKNLTPGQFNFERVNQGKKEIEFFLSDYLAEFEKIWNFQSSFYPNELNKDALKELKGSTKIAVTQYFRTKWNIYSNDIKKNKNQILLALRTNALKEKVEINDLVNVFEEINRDATTANSYLGNISNRSKILYTNNITIGQYLFDSIQKNKHVPLTGQIFYRNDYIHEFDKIWAIQAKHYPQLTDKLKSEIRDNIIFYQRRLKSQKKLISFCEFESKIVKKIENGREIKRKIGLRVSPVSSPIFQDFKIWQTINNIVVSRKGVKKRKINKTQSEIDFGNDFKPSWNLEQEEKNMLYNELKWNEKLSANEILKLLYPIDQNNFEINYKSLSGNKTLSLFYDAIEKLVFASGHSPSLKSKLKSEKITDYIEILNSLGTDFSFLLKTYDHYENNEIYKLWHLLYSYEGDNSISGVDKLIENLTKKYNWSKEVCVVFASIAFDQDYGSLSAKAMKKILESMRDGVPYEVAAEKAGYNHSHSLNTEEIENRILEERLDLVPKNSLRNPVVEKILNQTINVVNQVIDSYGKPDEIRLEMARELKKSATERAEMTKAINSANQQNEEIAKKLKNEFNLNYVSKNDIVRYKLYMELEKNGFKTLYSDTYIPREKLFSKEFDIEHIIPKSRIFDDSFSNKTLEKREVNIKKGDSTAIDFVVSEYGEAEAIEYEKRIERLFKENVISKTKYNNLLRKAIEIKDGFINRDLNDTRYIVRKAREILLTAFKKVNTTTGIITDRLREDWQIVDVMQELNYPKYNALGLTEEFTNEDGKVIKKIKDWTKRNDHRHHAMDALTVAFTTHSHVQYLNNLNARHNKNSQEYGYEQKLMYRNHKNKLVFKPPFKLEDFRIETKKHLNDLLVSYKAKNKVTTINKNKIKTKNGVIVQKTLTPRGSLHNETIYGKINQINYQEEKISIKFNLEKINTVTKKIYREALIKRLNEFGGDPKKAFGGKNTPELVPIRLNEYEDKFLPEKVLCANMEETYTIRKNISKDLQIDKVIDKKIQTILLNRLNEFGGNPQKAFSNLDQNPIWLNKEKGIQIKSIVIKGLANADALRTLKDKNGKEITDEKNQKLKGDFINTGSNHHVAIYEDENGNWNEYVMSMLEAVTRKNQGLSIIDYDYNKEKGWKFKFSMKSNEYFVFPNANDGFFPDQIDLKDPKNNQAISRNLYRVQKLASKDYFFRHHLETKLIDNKELKSITFKRIQSINNLKGIIKIRMNHLGEVVHTGEYL